MGRNENMMIFRDTETMCRTHPRLRESISFSRTNQKVILEGDEVSVSRGDGSEMGRLIVSSKRTFEAAVMPHYRTRFKVIEFAIYCRSDDTQNYDAFKTAFGPEL